MQKNWLLRRSPRTQNGADFLIQGPFDADSIRAMVKSADLVAEDELCLENSYWFSLQEYEELNKHLVISFDIPKSSDDEPTQPDIPDLDHSSYSDGNSQTSLL